jgi:predicted tellurium resistance membrane protein TerC
LLFKSTHEIHGALEGVEGEASKKVYAGFASVIIQIMLLDIVFSLDSVITAIGMVDNVWIMIAAVLVSIIAMMIFASSIGAFVQRHPTIKMLALAFLLMIGAALIADGLDFHIPKGYIYFAMAFSVFVEMLNIRLRKKAPPVVLHNQFSDEDELEAMEK